MKFQQRHLFALFLPVLLWVVTYGHSASATTDVTVPVLTTTQFAEAAEDFNTYCSVCHGRNAKGGGPVARELKTPPADLTRISARSLTTTRQISGGYPEVAVPAQRYCVVHDVDWNSNSTKVISEPRLQT